MCKHFASVLIIIPVTRLVLDSAKNIYTCSHAFFPFLKRQRFLCEIFILSQWREEHIGASRARVKTPLIFLHWIVFSSSFASFLGFFQFLANCDVFGELGQLWQFLNQVRVVPNVISPSLQIQSNPNTCIMHPLLTRDKELKLSFI